jgi:cytoskeleton protein RodZ
MVAEGSSPPSRTPPASGGGATTRSADSAGAYLEGLRLARGASLDDIARATRVGRRHLEALEADDAPELPAPVFVKGFIRAYCEFLQARPDEALERYRRQAPAHVPAPRSFGGIRRRAPSRMGSPIAVSLLLLAVLSGALIAVNLGLRSGGTQAASTLVTRPTPPPGAPQATSVTTSTSLVAAAPSGAPATPTAVTAPAAPAPPSTAVRPAEPTAPPPPAAPNTAPPPAPGSATTNTSADRGPQRLVVRAVEATWVRVQVDRSRAVEELLPEGAVREWSAEQNFVLTVGNAGGVELTLNGRRLPPLGSRGAVIRELVLPPQGGAPRS